jgi:glutathione S-transferase
MITSESPDATPGRPMRLIGHLRSINVRKVAWLLDLLQRPWRLEEAGTPENPLDSPALRALNPNAQMPTLVDGDFVLWESNAICRYLANRERRTDLYPAEPRARAQVDRWIDWQATDLNDAWRYAFMAVVRRNPAWQDPDAIAASVRAWNAKIAVLDAQLARTQAYVAGAAFTLADVPIGLSLHRWKATPIDKPAFPSAEAYYARLGTVEHFATYARADVP